jgi:peptidyl-prolyl cis-trans isomerase SurA
MLTMSNRVFLLGACLMFLYAAGAAAQEKGKIIEEVVARVNSDVITRSDLENARQQLVEEVTQACTGCTAAEIQDKVNAADKDLLRDLIDNSLLVQRGKDMGIDVETDVVKRLDEIRQENKLASMEELEKRVEQAGKDYQDFKNQVQDQILQQEVIRREVVSKIIVDHAEVLKYYQDHKQEFERPETVVLREIYVSTKDKNDAEIPPLQKKAEGLVQRVRAGEDFGELAKRYSDADTAKDGGELGTFEKGKLGANLEAAVFKLNKNEITDVLPIKDGFEILQVVQRYAAGVQPEDKVDTEITNMIYDQKTRPALRDYLDMLRMDSFVEVKPGYEDTAAVAGTAIEEVPSTPDEEQTKKSGLLPFGKKK